ncbi:MAG: flagellar assembly protein FliX [Alphaproteobacteria bacterium]
MKITGPVPISPTLPRRSKGARGARETEFAAEVPGAPSPASQVIPGTAVGAIEGILALQEVSDENGGRSRGVARGYDILDRLEEIRHGLLMGAIPRDRLVGLREQVQARRETVTDPRLSAILEEIDLRAAVELAKLGVMK